jgi:hypothetical protein
MCYSHVVCRASAPHCSVLASQLLNVRSYAFIMTLKTRSAASSAASRARRADELDYNEWSAVHRHEASLTPVAVAEKWRRRAPVCSQGAGLGTPALGGAGANVRHGSSPPRHRGWAIGFLMLRAVAAKGLFGERGPTPCATSASGSGCPAVASTRSPRRERVGRIRFNDRASRCLGRRYGDRPPRRRRPRSRSRW